MTTAILNQFENLSKRSFGKLIVEEKFKSIIKDFLDYLCEKNLDEIAKTTYSSQSLQSSTINQIELLNNLITFSGGILDYLDPDEGLASAKEKLAEMKNHLHNHDIGLSDVFGKWQQFFKECMQKSNNKDLTIQLLWDAYLAKQKESAVDPYSKTVKESFDGYFYQVNADPLKRLGALLFELLSETLNGFTYVASEGKVKLFDDYTGDQSSGVEQMQKYWSSMTGNKYSPN